MLTITSIFEIEAVKKDFVCHVFSNTVIFQYSTQNSATKKLNNEKYKKKKFISIIQTEVKIFIIIQREEHARFLSIKN